MKLPDFIVNDLGRKLTALVFASLIWVSVHFQLQETDTLHDIPVTVELDETLAMLDKDLPRVSVQLRGPKRRLNELTRDDVRFQDVRVSEAADGLAVVQLRRRNIVVPAGVTVSEIRPDSVRVSVDRVITVDRKVQVRFEGQLAPDIGRRQLEIYPPTVRVTGPANIVNAITSIETAPIELNDNISRNFDVSLKLSARDRVSVVPEVVDVRVEVYRKRDQKVFEDLDVLVVNSDKSQFVIEEFMQPQRAKVEVVVDGPKATIDDILTASSIRPFLDISDVTKSGPYSLLVHVHIDAKDCFPLEIEPMLIKVRVGRRQPSPDEG